MTTVLGIDPGLKHFGVALAAGPLATPLSELTFTTHVKTARTLADLATTHQAKLIILGLPHGKLAPFVRRFGQVLSSFTSAKIIFHPETLSTHDALLALRSAHASRHKLRREHSYAACLILEDYLDSPKNNDILCSLCRCSKT